MSIFWHRHLQLKPLLTFPGIIVIVPLKAIARAGEDRHTGVRLPPDRVLLQDQDGTKSAARRDWMDILSYVPFPVSVLKLRADYSEVMICLLAQVTLGAAIDNSILRSDQNGWIQLSAGSEQLWVTVEQK